MDEREFQRVCGDFVNREVYCCVSTMAEYILKKSWEDSEAPFSNDDIENPMQSAYISIFGESYEIADESELDEWKSKQEDINDELLNCEKISEFTYEKYTEQIQEAYDEALEQIQEYKEIFEYWICSPWLISKLSERNEAVIPHEQIWCRCTTGQSISIDGVIREIIKEYVLTDEEKASLKEK